MVLQGDSSMDSVKSSKLALHLAAQVKEAKKSSDSEFTRAGPTARAFA